MTAGVLALAVLIVAVAAVAHWNTRTLRIGADDDARSRDILTAISAVRTAARTVQAEQRAYLITGFPDWVTPFEDAVTALRTAATELATVTAHDPAESRLAAQAIQEIDEGVANLREVVRVRGGPDGHAAVVALAERTRRTGRRSFIDPLLETLKAMDVAERDRLDKKEQVMDAAYQWAVVSEVVSACTGVAAIALFTAVLRRSQRERDGSRRQLAEQWELLDATLSSIGDAVIATDAVGNVTFLNPVAEKLTGWPSADARGLPLDRVFRIVNESTRLPVDNPALRALVEGVIVGLANHTILIARDGTERPIDDSAAPIRGGAVGGADGVVAGAVLVFRDITDKKQIETALRVREERYRLLVTAASDVVYVMSPDWSEMQPLDGRALVASNAVPIRSWMEKNLPPSEHAAVREGIRRAIGGKQPFEIEHRVIRADGSVGWTHSRAVPILDATGNITEWFGTARDVTDRKQASEEVARLAEALGLALAAAELGTWEWEPATDAMVLSSRAAAIYGVDPAGPHRREALRRLLHPDDRDRARAAAGKAVADRADYDVEYRLIRPDGGTVWVAARGRGEYDASGNLVRMNGVAQDITARKQAEHELRDIRSRMETALEAGAIGTWTWDVPGDRFHGDPSVARIFNVPLQAVGGGPLSGLMDSIHPDDHERVGGLVARAVETGGRYEADYRVTNGTGGWRWVTARGQVERDATGRAVRFPGVVIDITDRKWAEEALAHVTAESERRRRLYEAVLSNTPDLAYVWGLDHRFAYANEGLLRMWGKTWDEAIGRNCLELGYEPWHAAMHDREIEEVRATRQPLRGEVPFAGTFGRRIYDYLLVPVFGADGEVEAVAGITRDVTERQEMEQELRDSDRKKDEFIALLAHELRNPLAPIRSGLRVLQLAPDGAVRGRTQTVMERQLGHMVRMIDDLLDVSRIGRHKMDLRRSRVQLADAVASAVETVRSAIDEAGHELTVSLPPDPVYLDADPTRLAQVFANLLANSAKYTDPGGRIRLTAEQDGGTVRVSVRDTGIGIPSESLRAVFDLFSQVHRTSERASGGLGIGLALVKGLVELHGGTVAAASGGPGRGSTFTVALPVVADATAAPEVTAGETLVAAGCRVLVADDNKDGRETLGMLLELLGAEVRMAADGDEAVAVAEGFRPQLVLMDLGMPRCDGLEATRRIRATPWGKDITVVALTGWGQEADRERTREAGCDGHLVKPVEPTELSRLLSELPRRE